MPLNTLLLRVRLFEVVIYASKAEPQDFIGWDHLLRPISGCFLPLEILGFKVYIEFFNDEALLSWKHDSQPVIQPRHLHLAHFVGADWQRTNRHLELGSHLHHTSCIAFDREINTVFDFS